jgi:hyperosmotically inducible periplasmic protein
MPSANWAIGSVALTTAGCAELHASRPRARVRTATPLAPISTQQIFDTMQHKSSSLIAFVLAASALVPIAGCAVARDQQTVGSYLDDAAITTKVKGRFAEDKAVSAMAISVETLKGTVQLSGFAKTAAERTQAERIARETGGVVSVKNDIAIRP